MQFKVLIKILIRLRIKKLNITYMHKVIFVHVIFPRFAILREIKNEILNTL